MGNSSVDVDHVCAQGESWSMALQSSMDHFCQGLLDQRSRAPTAKAIPAIKVIRAKRLRFTEHLPAVCKERKNVLYTFSMGLTIGWCGVGF